MKTPKDKGDMREMTYIFNGVLQQEFSDIGDVAEVMRVCIRLSVAIFLGALLGCEREMSGTSTGLRTHMLVALGSAMFVLVPMQHGVGSDDLTRVLQGIVAGIGFLGTGTIIKLRDDQEVKGLTTAASIWLTCAVGIAAGMGHQATALLSTLFALGILALVSKLFGQLAKRRHLRTRFAPVNRDQYPTASQREKSVKPGNYQ